jgi:hypothetical protein
VRVSLALGLLFQRYKQAQQERTPHHGARMIVSHLAFDVY